MLAPVDITRAAGLDPETSRVLLSTLLAGLDDAGETVALLEPDGGIAFVNRALTDLLGYDADELRALSSWLDVVAVSDRERVAAEAAHRLAGNRVREPVDALLVARDGRSIRFEATMAPVHHDGRVRLIAIGRDVGDRRAVEERTRYQRSLLEAQAESTIDGMLVVSPDGRMLSHNRRFREVWDFPEELVVVGDDEAALQAALDRVADPDAFIARVRELYANPQMSARDELLMRDGRVLDRYGAPVTGADGTYYGRIWVFRDITEHRRQEQRLAFLANAGAVLDASLDVARTLQTVTGLFVPELAERCTVHMVGDPLETGPDGAVATVLRTGHSQIVRSPAECLAGAGSAMLVALRARQRTIGVLMLSAPAGRTYDGDDLRLVADVAGRAALALDNARLYEERSRVATTLQRSLLPERLPESEGLELAARYRPAGAESEVGGDFYDAFADDDGGVVLVMGDVCGKGAQAAALTALARHTVRAAALRESDPLEVLALLDAAIRRGTADGRFCTIALCHLRPVAGGVQVTAACGGHPAPFVLRPGAGIEELHCRGGVLGLGLEAPSTVARTVLAPGDVLLLFTDGLTDARINGRLVAPETVVEWCSGLGGRSAEDVVATIERRLADARAELRDDVALLAARVRERA